MARLCALAAVAGLVGTINGYIHHHFRSRGLASARTLEDIRGLDWQEFEQPVADAYKRKGYSRVVETDRGPDGGIDIVLFGPDKVRVAVQCKQWRSRTIGEPKMRDFLGALTHQEFDRGIFITSSTFTPGAKTVAEKNRIDLVDGSKLLELVKDVQVSNSPSQVAAAEPRPEPVMKPAAPPSCPECGGQMALRTARKGPNSGSEFWGCSSYPTCRGTQPLRQS